METPLKNMETLGWPPFIDRRSRQKLTMFYKIRNNLICVPDSNLILNRRKPGSFVVPSSSVDAHLHSFLPSTVRLWNPIPSAIKTSSSVASFKASLEKITPPIKKLRN